MVEPVIEPWTNNLTGSLTAPVCKTLKKRELLKERDVSPILFGGKNKIKKYGLHGWRGKAKCLIWGLIFAKVCNLGPKIKFQ